MGAVAVLVAPPAAAQDAGDPAEIRSVEVGAFAFDLELVLPGPPEEIYDALTGDVSGWWDHRFSEDPVRFVIEPEPGGGFWEIFDESGDGVLHATVIAADRPRLLRFDGPLGLAGNAIHMVHTFTLEPVEDGRTRLTVTVSAAGQMAEEWPEAVERTWRHFMYERFAPYVESGRHRSG